ncbi:hypothetical protein ACTWQB_05395 [Piscibacillus sp. B03]|uniref:hypothetical protein n=1 Tax=Piscibacillus sp. B03 TaxID=3457430 RepID=UPI003FCD8D01
MSKKYNDEFIEKLLSEMPRVEDEKSFDEYYDQISKEITDSNDISSRRNRGWLLPLLTSAAALAIVVVIAMQFINFNDTADQMIFHNAEESEDTANNDMEGSSSKDFEENIEGEESAEEAGIMDSVGPQLLYEDDLSNENLQSVTMILPGPESQYFIPLTFLLSDADDPYSFFNNLDDISDQYLSLTHDFINGIEFVGNNNQNEPIIQVAEDSLHGTATEYALFEVLRYFNSIGHTTIELQNDKGETLELPHTGQVMEHSFSDQSYVYKLYNTNNGSVYWVRKPLTQEATLNEALNELRVDESIGSSTVPSNIEIEVNDSEDILEVQLKSDLPLKDQEMTLRMIESILLTAGTFGFDQVHFTDLDLETVGPYQLNTPVEIPEHINVQ